MNDVTLLTNASILTMDDFRRLYGQGAILIEGERISKVGRTEDLKASSNDSIGVNRINMNGRWILPGLINTHVHLSQQLARGLADDVDLLTWLHDRIWPYESSMTEEDSYVSSLLCGIELIRSGVTCFAEAGGQFVNGMARALTELGIRGILARSTMDMGEGLPKIWQENTDEALQAQVDNYQKWNGMADGRIGVWFGLRTIFNNSDELILRTKELADELGAGVHMHVAEIEDEVTYAQENRGARTVTHLNHLGVLDENFLAAHVVWLTSAEIHILAERDVKVSHNPAAAMRVLGFADIPEMIDRGVCVSLGTDGAPANNRMTLIDEMWLASLIHKGRHLDPTVMPAEDILEMVTRRGARALLMEDEIGSIESGKKADLIVVDPHTATMLPMHDPVANLVYAMRAGNVDSVMVDGKWVMKGGDILVVNEQDILDEAQHRAEALAKRAGIHLPDRFEVVNSPRYDTG